MTFKEFKEKFQFKEVIEISSLLPKKPLVSVLVQTFKQKSYIRECVESILMQEATFDYEILIGEDGSNDGTKEICIEYEQKFPGKIRLFLHHRENQIKVLGEGTSNFNAFYNLYSSRGKFIAFCEGDDLWTDPNKLQTQIDFLIRNTDYILAYHSYETINTIGDPVEIPEEMVQPKTDIDKKDLIAGIYHPLLLTVCFKKSFKEIPKEMMEVINADTFLLSFLGNYGNAKFQENIKPSKYRKHPGGIWSTRQKEKKILSKIITYYQLAQFYSRENNITLCNLYRDRYLNHYKMLLVIYFKSGKMDKFLSTYFKFVAASKKTF